MTVQPIDNAKMCFMYTFSLPFSLVFSRCFDRTRAAAMCVCVNTYNKCCGMSCVCNIGACSLRYVCFSMLFCCLGIRQSALYRFSFARPYFTVRLILLSFSLSVSSCFPIFGDSVGLLPQPRLCFTHIAVSVSSVCWIPTKSLFANMWKLCMLRSISFSICIHICVHEFWFLLLF